MRFFPRTPNRAVHPVLVWLALACFLPALFYNESARRAASIVGYALPDQRVSAHMQAGHGTEHSHGHHGYDSPVGEQTQETEDDHCPGRHCLLCFVPGLPGSFLLFAPGVSPPLRLEHSIPAGQPAAAPDIRHAPSRAPPASFA